MTISYTMTPDDYYALNRFVWTHDPRYRIGNWATHLTVPLINLLLWRFAYNWSWLAACIGAGITLLIWAPILTALRKWKAANQLKAAPQGLRDIQLTLSDDGLRITSQLSSGVTAWKAVQRVATDRRAVYLFVSRRMAYIVPLRAFGSEAELAEFVSFASSHIGR